MVIRSIADLERALTNRRIVGLFAHEPLSLQLTRLTVQETAIWQHRLNARVRDCGCGLGAVFALFAGVGVLLLSLTGSSITVGLLVRSVLKALLAAFCFGLGGKILGLSIAKLRLSWDCRRLLDAVRRDGLIGRYLGGVLHVGLHEMGRPGDHPM